MNAFVTSDEVGGEPTADRHTMRRDEVHPRSETLLPNTSAPTNALIEQERGTSLHCERLPDDAAGILRKA
jgi:hypothetical protein